jgi:hypothetical protein
MVAGLRRPRNRQVGGSSPPSGSRSVPLFRSSGAAVRLTFVPIRGWLEVQRIGGLACWVMGTPWGAALPGAYCCHSSAVGEPNSEQILTNGSLSRAGSHSRTILSRPAVASSLPFGAKRHRTHFAGVAGQWSADGWPVVGSHSRTVPSSLAAATVGRRGGRAGGRGGRGSDGAGQARRLSRGLGAAARTPLAHTSILPGAKMLGLSSRGLKQALASKVSGASVGAQRGSRGMPASEGG